MGLFSHIKQTKRLVVFGLILGGITMISSHTNSKKIDIQGHRGCRGLMPENTIPAFLKATELGVTTLELDVVISADGNVVVSHEAFLNPEICLNPEGKKIAKTEVYNLYKMNYEEIKRCDCGTLPHPKFTEQQKITTYKPLLGDVIKAVQEFCVAKKLPLPNFNVEIKSKTEDVLCFHPPINTFVDSVVAVLQANLPENKFTIQSFDITTLQYSHQQYPQLKLAFLTDGLGFKTPAEVDAELETLGFVPAIYSCYFKMLTGDVVKHLWAKNMLVIPWTVNKPEDILAMKNLGVDGIITDYPNRLLND